MTVEDVAHELDAAPTDAADTLIRRHLRGVWRYCLMLGARPGTIDDLVQEAFVIALQKGAAGLEPAATGAFLRRTARFLFLRSQRRSAHDPKLLDAIDELWARDHDDDHGERAVAAARGCVELLDGRSKLAVEITYGIGGSPPGGRNDLATKLEMKENGVKTLLQRTRKFLRECIERRLS